MIRTPATIAIHEGLPKTEPTHIVLDKTAETQPGLWSSNGLEAVAHLLSAILWPVIVVSVLYKFRIQISSALASTKTVKFGSFELTVDRVLQAAEDAVPRDSGVGEGPTRSQVRQAVTVEALAGSKLGFVRDQVDLLAAEYERVRSSLSPGDYRTREMEQVVAKMRVVGRAAFPLRHELARSKSPGKRLQAIATLQVEPDEEYLTWLVERLSDEKPFIGYHAAVALLTAVNSESAIKALPELEAAAQRAKTVEMQLSSDSDRQNLLKEFSRRVAEIRSPAPQ